MIKEKLMSALKAAAADYNGGMGADASVAKAAAAADFNEKQAERLVEMFNTLAALNKEKDASDPTGSCELASKEKVAGILVSGVGEKKASFEAPDYSFYLSDPRRTNATIEAREAGRAGMAKAAFADEARLPDELNVSQRSLYKIISEQIDQVKAASDAAYQAARAMRAEADRAASGIARAVEAPFADARLADMFKAACAHKKAVEAVAEYSTKVAESDGGEFARMNVFDTAPVDVLLEKAAEFEDLMEQADVLDAKGARFADKAAEAEDEMRRAVGLAPEPERPASLADMFTGVAKSASSSGQDADSGATVIGQKIAELVRKAGAEGDAIEKLAAGVLVSPKLPDMRDARAMIAAVTSHGFVDHEQTRMLNARRALILAELMSEDPIIRDADPDAVTEAYKTVVMTAPRVSLDKAQVRAFLRSAVNSVAVSPTDAKVLADVDRGTQVANVDALTLRDSSIKDSNQ